jgi:hypothetical protein
MATFNAETAIKATDKRLDKLEASVLSLERSVKLLIETRGESKDAAVVKLQALVQEQAKEFDKMPLAQTKALEDAMKANAERFGKMIGLERATARAEFEKADAELHKEVERQYEALSREAKEMDARVQKLNEQAAERERKRADETQKAQKAMQDLNRQAGESARAQGEAMSKAIQLEARFARLEVLVHSMGRH